MASRRGFSGTSDQGSQPLRGEIHPVWRGIGCIMMFLIPLVSFVIAHELVMGPLLAYIPRELSASLPVRIPPIPDAYFFFFFAKILVACVIALLVFGLFTIVYSLLYRAGGGMRRSVVDAPPPMRSTRRR